MKTSSLIKCSLGLAASGSLLLSASARADVVSYTENYGSISAGGPGTSVSLPGFNSSLGTLTGITFDLSSSDTVSVSIISILPGSTPYSSASASLPVTITSSLDGVTTTATGTATYGSGFVNEYPPALDLPGETTTASSTVNVPSADFSEYEGGGTYTVGVTTGSGNYSGVSSPGVFFGGAGSSTGSVEVTYDYTVVPTPEPSSLLGGFGILGSMAAMAWRKRKQ
jgi:hypothetical protein